MSEYTTEYYRIYNSLPKNKERRLKNYRSYIKRPAVILGIKFQQELQKDMYMLLKHILKCNFRYALDKKFRDDWGLWKPSLIM